LITIDPKVGAADVAMIDVEDVVAGEHGKNHLINQPD